MKIILPVLTTIFVLSSPCSGAFAETFESAETQVNLIELYTSEGCSSCPPAEAWLNSLKNKPGLWRGFIPLAFHVAYWDYLGWKDHMGSVQNADRQRQYAASWGTSSVYTPGLIKNGLEWRGWQKSNDFAGPSNVKVGRLKLHFEQLNDIHLSFESAHKHSTLIGNMVLLGFEIETDVRRGENSGKVLKHDFVVLEHQSKTMDSANNHHYHVKFSIEKEKYSDVLRFAIAGWVNEETNLTPIQASGGFIN